MTGETEETMDTESGVPEGIKTCCEGIDIPESLPGILKTFTRSAITTQPRDLVHWAAAYFRAMSLGQIPPVKDRLEFPVDEAPNGLTKGLLRILHKQLGQNARMDHATLLSKWTDICLSSTALQTILASNGLNESDFSWTSFVAAAAASMDTSDFAQIMDTVCYTITAELGTTKLPKEQWIPVQIWLEAYLFLGQRLGIPTEAMDAVVKFIQEKAMGNGGMVGPSFVKQDPSCPPLDGRRP